MVAVAPGACVNAGACASAGAATSAAARVTRSVLRLSIMMEIHFDKRRRRHPSA
jgi:hypothetical protein